MRIVLNIPEAFRAHYERDRFDDSLNRILQDIESHGYLAGNYEIETIIMLTESFRKSEIFEGQVYM